MNILQEAILKRMDEEELKPCPFCGGKAKFYEKPVGKYIVVCTECGACNVKKGEWDGFSFYTSIPDAKKAWNQRVTI
jgi:hypothetical protein